VDLPESEANQRIIRHKLAARLYHWVLAACVITLMVTAFGPHLGWLFNWVTIHWAVGIILTLLVVGHIAHSISARNVKTMALDGHDIRQMSRGEAPHGGKYEPLQKVYHWGIAALILLLIVTGALILSKMDTPLWRRNPYWLPDGAWSVIYTIHDFAALGTLASVIVHIYFAVRPDNAWMLRSMIRGWITRREYLSHHDPQRWEAEKSAPPARPAPRNPLPTSTSEAR